MPRRSGAVSVASRIVSAREFSGVIMGRWGGKDGGIVAVGGDVIEGDVDVWFWFGLVIYGD